MSSEELAQWRKSIRRGRWAFTYAPQTTTLQQPFTSDALLTLQTESEFARSWCITLVGFKYSGGTLPLTNTQPPDNQTVASSRVRAKIQWGVEGGSEIAIVDYMPRGCCFQVQAANLRLSLFSEGGFSVGTAIPTLAGFITPMPRFAVVDMSPTFTTGLFLVTGSGGTFVTPIPARAVAYRAFTQSAATSGQTVSLDQLQENGATVTQHDATLFNSSPGSTGEDFQGNRQGYFPLNPFSQFVRATNVTAGNISMGLQFLLDMG